MGSHRGDRYGSALSSGQTCKGVPLVDDKPSEVYRAFEAVSVTHSKKELKLFTARTDLSGVVCGVFMRKIKVCLLILALMRVCGVDYGYADGFHSAPFGVAMRCGIIGGDKVCATQHDPATSGPPDKPCDASSRGNLLASIEYTTSTIRFCVTDTCTNGLRVTDRIPYTNDSYQVLYYVCGETGWDLKCTTKTEISSQCARASTQVSCKDCDGKVSSFTPTTLGNPKRTQTSTPELGCRDVLAKYRPQVESERRAEQLAYETILAQSAIARTAAAQSTSLGGQGRSCVRSEVTVPNSDF
jgi:hypothetical protein